jgi:protein-S-isoprenylcysteine O-methyltransferase Ste14
MAKIIGYIVAVIGLAVIVLSLRTSSLPLISSVKPAFVMIAGICLVIVGLAFSMSGKNSGKIKQASEEVPIYEGEGKERKIVAYKKEVKR